MSSPEYIFILVFVGMAVVVLIASILALQGRNFIGSRMMLGGIAAAISSAIGIAGLFWWGDFLYRKAYFSRERNEDTQFWIEFAEDSSLVLILATGISLLLTAIGFFLVTRQWVVLHLKCINLELETKRLSELRESLPSSR